MNLTMKSMNRVLYECEHEDLIDEVINLVRQIRSIEDLDDREYVFNNFSRIISSISFDDSFERHITKQICDIRDRERDRLNADRLEGIEDTPKIPDWEVVLKTFEAIYDKQSYSTSKSVMNKHNLEKVLNTIDYCKEFLNRYPSKIVFEHYLEKAAENYVKNYENHDRNALALALQEMEPFFTFGYLNDSSREKLKKKLQEYAKNC